MYFSIIKIDPCMYQYLHSLILFFFTVFGFSQNNDALNFNSNNSLLDQSFNWAKNKALSYVHDDSDQVGYWYEAALPNREAFCMRDVSHQAIGAEILGLSKHNYNMFLKFAENISKEKDYCSFWEINRYDKPAPVDYENDKDFWYNLPANFDLIYNVNRLYAWTGNKEYLYNPFFKNFYELSLNNYVEHWELGHDKVANRNRNMHQYGSKSRFGNKRGIPTYNEGGRGETRLGIDMTASVIAAYQAYSEILMAKDETGKANEYNKKVRKEQEFLDAFWWDDEKETYRSILYKDNSFDYFMVGNNQAFLHYLFYFDAIDDQKKARKLIGDYILNYDMLIVELKSYLPIIFYEYGYSDIATKMIIELCSPDNKRRDYPENSFTVIEHLTRGLMGVNVQASINTVSTVSRLEEENDWAEMQNIPVLSNKISLKHQGNFKTSFMNQLGPAIYWNAQLHGKHKFLFVNGKRKKCLSKNEKGQDISYLELMIKEGEKITVTVNK